MRRWVLGVINLALLMEAIFQEQGGSLIRLGQAFPADHAHTVAVDQATHRVYFPIENVNGKPVLRIMDA